jgi:hypothetical protein
MGTFNEVTMRPAAYAVGTLLITVIACGSSPAVLAGPSSSDLARELEVRATAEGLELTNHGTAAVYYRARDPLSLALSDAIPCREPTGCSFVPAKSRVTVPFEETIVGYRTDTELALVHWWHFVRQPDGSVAADEVRTLEVILSAP